MADAAACAGEEQRAARLGVVVRYHFSSLSQGNNRVVSHGALFVLRRNCRRSCNRYGRSCQNSIASGVIRKPDQLGGREMVPTANRAICRAIAFSNAKRLSSGADCLLAQAPTWARRGRVAK